MDISEFLLIVEQHFSELGDPRALPGACCPLGLIHRDPQDPNPDPVEVAEVTGLPLEYCIGVADAWDNAPGSFYAHSWSTDRRTHYHQGFRDGGAARYRWFKEHPRVSPVEKPSR